MKQKYIVRATGVSPAEFELAADGALSLAPGAETPLRVLRREKNGMLTLLYGDRIISGVVGRGEQRGEFTVSENGRTFVLRVRNAALDALEQAIGSVNAAGQRLEIRTPIPGLIKAINVEAGSNVEAGQTVIVLEAMKMENEISAPHAGAIESVAVKVGQAVAAGELLAALKT